jgi:electron transfer flavoprotein alpha subunit
MSVLIFAETAKGSIKKASLEAISYGAQIAAQLQTTATAVVGGAISNEEAARAGEFGVSKVLLATNLPGHFDPMLVEQLVLKAVEASSAKIVVFSHDYAGRSVAPRIAARLKAGLVSGAVALPDTSSGFVVRKNVFSGKALAEYQMHTEVKVITLLPNSVPAQKNGSAAAVEAFDAALAGVQSSLKIEKKVREHKGGVLLTEAELVVSAGRGMKDPSNWNIIEELAETMGAATACSRPVSDIGWRPHHEHVGQTGIAIRPNLYIAVGISGAIQHLAGVNGSKVIVVINKDPEAPFFKAADYGVVGDAMEVVPRLTEAFRKFKAANS